MINVRIPIGGLIPAYTNIGSKGCVLGWIYGWVPGAPACAGWVHNQLDVCIANNSFFGPALPGSSDEWHAYSIEAILSLTDKDWDDATRTRYVGVMKSLGLNVIFEEEDGTEWRGGDNIREAVRSVVSERDAGSDVPVSTSTEEVLEEVCV